MNIEHFTEKSQEAVSAAHRLAAKMSHQQMDVEHLLIALLDQERGLATSLLNKAEISGDAIKIRAQQELEKRPRVSGGNDQVSMTGRLNRVFGRAEEEAKKLKDEYISVEHLLLAMLDDDGATGRILKEFG